MAIKLFGDPFNLQGNNQNLQGGYNPQLAANPQQPSPVPRPVPLAAPRTVIPTVAAPRASAPRAAQPSVYFYKPDPNSQQVYNAQGQPLSYEQYIAQGGMSNFRNVLNQAPPGQQVQASQSFSTGNPNIELYQNPNQQLASSAGQAGLGFDDYMKIVSGQSGLSVDEQYRIKEALGIPALENAVFTPSKGTEQIYKDAYKSSGLGNLKTKIEAKLKEISIIQSKYIDAEGKVNENPFLSEASRIGRLSRLEDKRQAQIGNMENEVNSLNDLYNSGINEVNSLVTRVSTDLGNQRNLDSLKLQYLLSTAEEQIKTKQAEKTNEAYQYLPDYLKAKASAQKPDTIGSNETGFYRWNPNTQTFEQVIAPSVTPNFQANPLTGELFNTKTGLGAGGGVGAGLSFNAGAQGMRTDRHNNPTAFTTDIARQAGLKEGVDYVVGDPFPNNPNLKTAKLLGDPIATTIKVIDSIGFYTQSGQPRWTYVNQIPDAKNWANLSPGQKANVIAQMYQREGGNGSLVQGGGQVGTDVIGQLAQQVLRDPQLLYNLPSAQQTAVTARLAQMGASIPGKPLSAEASKLSGIVQTLPNEIEQLKAAFRKDYKGSLTGIVTGTNRQLSKLLDQVADKVGRLRSGGAINRDEEARFKRQIASFMDIPFGNMNNAIAALDGVLAEARTVAQGIQPGSQSSYQSGNAGNVNLSDLNFNF